MNWIAIFLLTAGGCYAEVAAVDGSIEETNAGFSLVSSIAPGRVKTIQLVLDTQELVARAKSASSVQYDGTLGLYNPFTVTGDLAGNVLKVTDISVKKPE